jgi:hypothetical protein
MRLATHSRTLSNMRARRWSRASAWLLAVAGPALAACDLTQLDAIAEAPGGSASNIQGNPSPQDAGNAGDADGASAADAPGEPPLEAGPLSLPCASDISALAEWTFDSTVEGWIAFSDTGGQATLGWNGSLGDPSPGALEVDVTPKPNDAGVISGAEVAYDMPSPTDLSLRTIAAWVRLESGAPPHLKTMVQTGAQYAWADNGTTYLTLGAWTCVSLDVSTPSYSQPQYDPTQVIRLGFEMLGTTPFVLAIDDVHYY